MFTDRPVHLTVGSTDETTGQTGRRDEPSEISKYPSPLLQEQTATFYAMPPLSYIYDERRDSLPPWWMQSQRADVQSWQKGRRSCLTVGEDNSLRPALASPAPPPSLCRRGNGFCDLCLPITVRFTQHQPSDGITHQHTSDIMNAPVPPPIARCPPHQRVTAGVCRMIEMKGTVFEMAVMTLMMT